MQIKIYIFNTKKDQFSNYSYLIEDIKEKKAILIDPSWDANVYESFLINNNLCIEAVLLTHSHTDHTNLSEHFANKYNIPIYMSEAEIISYNFRCPNLHMVYDKQLLRFKNISILCLLLPGHTRGSMGYLIENNIFVGDVLFFEGCGTCTYNEESISDMYNSIQRIVATCTPNHNIYPGHVYYKTVGQKLEKIMKNNLSMTLSKDEFFEYQRRLQKRGLFSNKQL